jgi:ABC-type branched-subunit amino acid transport system substrate-binding protein
MLPPGATGLTRRGFLRAAMVATTTVVGVRRARAEDIHTVGLILPSASPTATQIEQGAALGLDDANALATLFGKQLRIETGTAANGAEASARASALVRRAGVIALVGGAGSDVADALRDTATREPTIFLNVAAIDDRLRNERCARQALHVAPSVSMYVDALAVWLGVRRVTRWALVTDETPRSREIAAAVRVAAASHGVTLVSANEPFQIALMALDGAALDEGVARHGATHGTMDLAGIGWSTAVGLPPAALVGAWIVGWHPDLEQFSGRELNARFRRRFGAPMTELAWNAWTALKLIGEAVVRGNARDAAGVLAFVESAPPFDGHKGFPLTFRRWDQQLRQPLYVMGRSAVGGSDVRGSRSLLGSVPVRDLDSIGTPAKDSRCRITS